MIDHLVYTVHNLPEATDLLARNLGVAFSPGGRHESRGTENVLLKIGSQTYFEILAVDHQNLSVSAPRWMGIDHLPADSPGRLSRWAWAVEDGQMPELPGSNKNFPPFEAGSRKLADGTTLKWQLTDPGQQPLIAANPFLIDWYGRPSPAQRLPESGCHLMELRVMGPAVNGLTKLAALDKRLRFLEQPEVKLEVVLRTPDGGQFTLS